MTNPQAVQPFTMSVQLLAEMSNKYGKNPEYVLAGGGNTSFKDKDFLYIKGSGTSLATIKPEEFVIMRRAELEKMWDKSYSENNAQRESEVLEDMMDARAKGQTGRPSVETLLHELFDKAYVLHLHPALVNATTCAKNGEAAIKALFSEALWIPAEKPGFILAKTCKKYFDKYVAEFGKAPVLLFLQNHGVFFAAETKADMIALIEHTCEQIRFGVTQMPQLAETPHDSEQVSELEAMVHAVVGSERSTCFFTNATLLRQSDGWQTVESCSLTPDHIVYLGHAFCCVSHSSDRFEQQQLLENAICTFRDTAGYLPKIIVIRGVGAFACAATQRDAETYRALFLDALKITVYARNFGGVQMMSNDLTDFIRNWEVERYRQQVFSSGNTAV